MNKNFIFTNNFNNKNIDIYIFVICNDLKKNIEKIQKLLDIEKLPKKLFENYKLNNDFEKKIYTDKYEIIFFGVNEFSKCNNQKLYEVFGKIGKSLSETENMNKNIIVNLITDDKLIIKNEVISLILGFYKCSGFKSEIKKNKSKIYFYYPKLKLKNTINNYIYEGEIQNEIRNLINTPSNLLFSTNYLSYIKLNSPDDIKIKVLNESKLKKLGCNLILGVNQGSKNKPMMIVLEYTNLDEKNYKKKEINQTNNINENIVLIGKGVMFDSGGYNIKRGDFSEMKNDMTGSAIVYAIFKLLSKFKIKGKYIGLLPIVENMVDANSIKPGDIIKSYNGLTVEITNTDAEGRLIIADALAYSEKFNPYICIDIATLTGQASQIFDKKSSVIMGNNNKYIQLMINSGLENNEKIWELPMWKEYIDMTKSNIADLKNNTYNSSASTIMAGAFLSNFIPKKCNWIHLDIAGTDSISNNNEMRYFGATGEIMRTVLTFLQKLI